MCEEEGESHGSSKSFFLLGIKKKITFFFLGLYIGMSRREEEAGVWGRQDTARGNFSAPSGMFHLIFLDHSYQYLTNNI